MKVLAVRVHKGSVFVDKEQIASIEEGLVVFLGIEREDTHDTLLKLAEKLSHLRVFEDVEGKLNYSLKDKNYPILCIPNFTLVASTQKGRRPSFEKVKSPQEAKQLFEDFILLLRQQGLEVKEGIFGKHMHIRLEMDGPVNIIF